MSTQPTIPHEDLPLWMRQARQEFDWGILIALAMSLAMAWTFLQRDELSAGHQLEHYIFQASDIVTAFEEGRVYPRWSPYAINGYGAPIPNYYPMGASYTIALVEALFTNDLHQAVRIVFVLTYAIAGVSVYVLVSRRTDAAIGLVASILYIYSPMIGSTIPHLLGDLPLLMAGGLLPLTLWSTYYLVTNNQPINFAIHSFIIAFFLWVHPQMMLLGVVISFVYGLLDQFDTQFFQRLIRLLFATVIGCLLVAFFWIPAIVEHDIITWHMNTPLQNHLISIEQLFVPMQQIDHGLLMPQPQFKLGWLVIVFSIMGGFIVTIIPLQTRRFYILTMMLGCGLLGLTLLFLPDQIWLLVPITLCFSILGGGCLSIRRYLSPQLSRLMLAICVGFILIFSLPVWLIPPPHIVMSSSDTLAQIRYEQQGLGISTLPDGLPLPSSIDPAHSSNRYLMNSLESNTPQRYEERQNNANTIVSLLKTSSHQQIYRIYNTTHKNLEFLIPYFDGWQAFLNNQQLEASANPTTSLLTIEVPPANNDELIITLASTPIRSIAWAISLGALLIVVATIIFRNPDKDQPVADMLDTMHRADVRLMLFMFVCLSIIISVLTSESPPIQLYNPPAYTLAQSLPLQSRTSAGFQAATFDINQRQFQHGDTIEITLYWQALTNIQSNYKVRASLRDVTNRLVWSTGELQTPGSAPTRRWIRNRFVTDTHHIIIADDLITAEYEILIELYPCDMATCNLSNPVTFFDLNGNATGTNLVIPVTITVH